MATVQGPPESTDTGVPASFEGSATFGGSWMTTLPASPAAQTPAAQTRPPLQVPFG